MGVVVGFVLGYVLGARAGKEGMKELEQAWRTISSSGEMKDILAGMADVARDLLRQGAGTLAHRMTADGEVGLRAA
jgi:hypothetical protein